MAMTTMLSFSAKTGSQRLCLKPTEVGYVAIRTRCQLQQKKTGCIYLKGKVENKHLKHRRMLHVRAASRDYPENFPGSVSPSDIIKQFYNCLNEKKLKQLGDYISADCCIEECSFNKPLQGKKEVMRFSEQLAAGMGKNVKFILGHVCEGDELIAAANWHMEWKNKQIPFTRGCSFFECSKQGDKLIIKKAQIVIESPIKPGTMVLSLLKTVTSLFDGFPRTTEWFLKSPHIILQWIWKIYAIIFAPFVESYLGLWKLAAGLLGYAYYILLYIAKLLFFK